MLRENSVEIKIAAINLARAIESLDLLEELAKCYAITSLFGGHSF